MIEKIILKNLFFHRQKTALTVALVSFLFFLGFAPLLFTKKVKTLADAPLNSLQTEIILQQDRANKESRQIKTSGVIEPFGLTSFDRGGAFKKLSHLKGISKISSVLILWQFDVQNNRTIVGLDVNDPLVGPRKVAQWLMPQGRFFSGNDAEEIILERHFAKLFGYRLNGRFQIDDKNYKIVGIVDFKEQSNLANAQIFVPYQTALALIGKKDFVVNQVYISLGKASSLPRVQKEIENIFPDFSIITKDSLLKNLSSFNRLVYKFGDYLSFGIDILVCLLIFWILKINRVELADQTKILRTIGWTKPKIRQWIFFESFFIMALSFAVSLVLLLIFSQVILPQIKIGVLLSQGFKL